MIDALGSSSPSSRLTLLAAASSCAQRAADLARSDLSASSGNDDNLVVLSALLAGGEAARVRCAASRAVALNPGDADAWGLLVVASAASKVKGLERVIQRAEAAAAAAGDGGGAKAAKVAQWLSAAKEKLIV